MQDPLRTILAVIVSFYGNNDIHIHHRDDPNKHGESLQAFNLNLVAGLQADVLESDVDTPLIENVGAPDEIFVHAGELSRMLGCTPQTARNRLEELESAGLASSLSVLFSVSLMSSIPMLDFGVRLKINSAGRYQPCLPVFWYGRW